MGREVAGPPVRLVTFPSLPPNPNPPFRSVFLPSPPNSSLLFLRTVFSPRFGACSLTQPRTFGSSKPFLVSPYLPSYPWRNTVRLCSSFLPLSFLSSRNLDILDDSRPSYSTTTPTPSTIPRDDGSFSDSLNDNPPVREADDRRGRCGCSSPPRPRDDDDDDDEHGSAPTRRRLRCCRGAEGRELGVQERPAEDEG